MKLKTFALLCACTATPAFAQDDYIRNAKEIVDKTDWKAMETVTVTLGEHYYEPTDLKLKAGKAYKLVLKNLGEKDHYYTAGEFFRSVAWRKAMVHGQAEFKAPYFTAVEVLKGGQLELYFVPVGKGRFNVICTIDDHREKGMEGTITVE